MQPTDKVSLTYEQVQALGEVIKNNIGQARELTTDDYDYPTDNPGRVAVWLLPSGMYTAKAGVRVQISSYETITSGIVVLVAKGASDSSVTILFRNLDSGLWGNKTLSSTGSINETYSLLGSNQVVNSLDSTSATSVLSATQGRTLNNKIRALANYSTTETDTGATWIDGSTIYKKTITKTGITAGNTNLVAHDITNLGTIVKLEGVLFANNVCFALPRPAAGRITDYVELNADSTNIYFNAGSTASFDSATATIYYTKSS